MRADIDFDPPPHVYRFRLSHGRRHRYAYSPNPWIPTSLKLAQDGDVINNVAYTLEGRYRVASKRLITVECLGCEECGSKKKPLLHPIPWAWRVELERES